MVEMHTPGPWWTDAEYSEEECGIAIIAANTDCGPLPGNPTRGMVAWASELLLKNAAQCEANARLIAAAPELLAVLQEIAAINPADLQDDDNLALGHAFLLARSKAIAAIARATLSKAQEASDAE